MLDGMYELPIALLEAFTAIVFVGVYWIGCFVLRFGFKYSGSDNTIVGTMLSAFGVLYGLLLALVTVSAYETLSEVEVEASSEASSILALYRDVSGFPEPTRGVLKRKLSAYCKFIIEKEWPQLRQGVVPQDSVPQIDFIRVSILDLKADSRKAELIQAQAVKHFEEMAEHGRKRRYASLAGIPTVMWYVLIVGTIINFVLMWMFEMPLKTHLFLGGIVSFFLGAIILLIVVLERPYQSIEFGVSPAPYEMVYQVMEADHAATNSLHPAPEIEFRSERKQ
jgi:hypothetical protein